MEAMEEDLIEAIQHLAIDNEDQAAQINNLLETVYSLTTQLDNSRNHVAALQKEKEEQQLAIDDRGQAAQINDLLDTVCSLTIQLDDSMRHVAALQKEKEEQAEEIFKQSWTIETLKADARKSQSELAVLMEEKVNWQSKFDGMYNRVHLAEKKLRSLDHITRIQVDARQSGRLLDIKRSSWFVGTGSETKILDQVTGLNAWIQSTAQPLARDLVYSRGRSNATNISRVTDILGEGMSDLVQTRARQGLLEGSGIVLRTLVEMFLVHWATMIIEAWYPKQQSFADILAELAAQQHTGRKLSRRKPLNILGTKSTEADFARWANDILQDFKDVVHVAGVTVPNHGSPDPSLRTFLTLLEKTWAVRQSLAERDLCRGMEVAVVVPETLFQAKWMEDQYAPPGAGGQTTAPALINAERVAGTCRLGLQISATTTQGATTPVLVLKPKVVLLSTIRDSP